MTAWSVHSGVEDPDSEAANGDLCRLVNSGVAGALARLEASEIADANLHHRISSEVSRAHYTISKATKSKRDANAAPDYVVSLHICCEGTHMLEAIHACIVANACSDEVPG